MVKKHPKLLIFMSWLLYTVLYLGRYSYNANIGPLMAHYGVTKSEIGLVMSFFFFSYGAGHLLNGLFCRYYNKRFVLPAAIFVSSALNIAVFFGVPFGVIKWMWLVNGISMSVMWSSLLLLLSQELDEKYRNAAIVVMSTTTPVGTAIAYGVSALLAVWNAFIYAFLIGAVVMTAVSLVWMLFYGYFVGKKLPKEEAPQEELTAIKKPRERKRVEGGIIAFVAVMCVLAVFNNFVKDGLHAWTPLILSEHFALSDGISILLTVFLSVLGTFGSMIAVRLHKKINDIILLCGVFFGASALLMGVAVPMYQYNLWYVALGIFGVVVLAMHAINSTITVMVPIEMKDKLNSGMTAGLLTGSCYVGSAISSYGLGAVSDHFGWVAVLYTFLGACILPALFSGGRGVQLGVRKHKAATKPPQTQTE